MKKLPQKLKKWQIITISICTVLACLIIILWLFYNSKLSLLNYNHSSDITVDTETQLPNDDLDISGLPQKDEDTGNIKVPKGDVIKNKDVFNILLIGTDDRTSHFSDNARADSMMILSIHKKNKTAKLVSLERAIGVPVPGRNDDWLTHTFRYGGANLTLKTIRDCFKVDVNRYVRVNFHTFEKVFDAVGGVDIELTELEANALNKENNNSKLKPGLNHLSGKEALQFSRLRSIDSDWKRIERQRKTIQAAVNQTKNMSIVDLNNFADTVLPLVETNLSKWEITSLLLEAPNFLGAELQQKTIPEKGTYWGKVGKDGRNLIAVDFEKNIKILQDLFSK